jgi:hypothetical protein
MFMSHKHFISPPDHTDWSITPEAFAAALKSRWPHVRIVSETPDRYQSVEFELDLQHSTAYAHLDADGQALIIDAHIEDVAELAVWFRSLVPDSQPLILYDEGYQVDVPVTRSSTARELAQPFYS